MTAYIVRDRGTKAMVGIFVAPSLRDLFWAMDEAGNPYAFEYRRFVFGGLYVDLCGRNTSEWPLEKDIIDDSDEAAAEFYHYPVTTEKMEMSETLRHWTGREKWKPVKRGMGDYA